MWWGLNINILECLAQNSHSKNGAFIKSVNPLLHPIDTINLQIEILDPKSSYICLIFVHPCCCHVVQVPTTSDLGPCNTAFSSLVASPNPFSILQSTDFTKYVFWLRSALLSIPHCLSAPDSFQDPRTLLLKTSFLTSLQSTPLPATRRLLCPSAIPPLGKPLISFTPSSLILVIFSAHNNILCKAPFPGELIAQASA